MNLWQRARHWILATIAHRGIARNTLFLLASIVITLVAKEVLLSEATNVITGWVGDAPLWVQILIGTVFVGAALAWLRLRRKRPKPDASVPSYDLPAPPSHLVGRDADLAVVSRLLQQPPLRAPSTVAVIGWRGVGTSAVAGLAADAVAEDFPDGAIYLDLRGVADRPAHTAASALHQMMNQLDLIEPRSSQRRDLDDAAHRLQAWYREHQILIFLNNVDDPQQVERLLPTAPGSAAILAGSMSLDALPHVRVHRLGALSEEAAVRLLTVIGGTERVAEDQRAARELVNICGRQPLAVRLLGHLIHDRRWPLSQFAAEMRQSARTSRHLPAGSLNEVLAAADVTYRDLSPEEQRLFRSLALAPSVEIGPQAAAAVAGIAADRTARGLNELARRGLVESARPGYFRVRQLLAESARYHLENEDTPRQRKRARFRLARYYGELAEQYAEPLLFARETSDTPAAPRDTEGYQWFDREHETLLRLITHPGPVDDELNRVKPWLWRIAMGLCTWYAIEGRLETWQIVCDAILRMPPPRGPRARFTGTDRLWRTNAAYWAHNELGVIHRRRGRVDEGFAELSKAAARAADHRLRSRAQVETNLGLLLIDKGDLGLAIRHLELGLSLRGRSDILGRAVSELGLGIACLHAYYPSGEDRHLGNARKHLSRAANDFERLGDRRGQAAALNALGLVLSGQGDRTGIEEHWDLARRHYSDIGDDPGQASVLLNVGADLLRTDPGQADAARRLLTESLQLRTGQPETIYTALAHARLGDAAALGGDGPAADRHHDEAARIIEELR